MVPLESRQALATSVAHRPEGICRIESIRWPDGRSPPTQVTAPGGISMVDDAMATIEVPMRGLEGPWLAIAVGGATLVLVLVVLAQATPAPVTAVCRSVSTLTENDTPYSACILGVRLADPSAPVESSDVEHLVFQGMHFEIYGYDTFAGAPVVNVTGHEPSGETYSLQLACLICQSPGDSKLSPDRAFGAIWDGVTTLTVLVRST